MASAEKRDKTDSCDSPDVKDSAGVKFHLKLEKDENGYGLTVSGDNPVFVSSVKEHGAAEKAGVQQGDKIVKVNGNLVTQCDHKQVVKLIKGNSVVNLTVLRTDPSEKNISTPQAVDQEKEQELQNAKIATIRMYYERVWQECEELQARESGKGPPSVELQDKRKLLQSLETQLLNITGIPVETQLKNLGTNSTSLQAAGLRKGSGDVGHSAVSESVTLRSSLRRHKKTNSESYIDICDGLTNHDVTVSRSNSDPRRATVIGDLRKGSSADSVRDITKPETSNLDSYDLGEASPTELSSHATNKENAEKRDHSPHTTVHTSTPTNRKSMVPQLNQAAIMSMDEDELHEEHDETVHVEEHSPFSDLQTLKSRPAYMAVFLKFLMCNYDPSPLLFYLVTDQYQQGSGKEMRKWAYEIFSTFLHTNAPLRVDVAEDVLDCIIRVIEGKNDRDDNFKQLFGVARHVVQKEITYLLSEFKRKRLMGLHTLYGAECLANLKEAGELKVTEEILWEEYEKLVNSKQDCQTKQKLERNQALVLALTTFFRAIGLQPSKQNTALERGSSFALRDNKDKQSSKFIKFGSSKSKAKGYMLKGHNLVPQQYITTTYCSCCNQLIWGAGFQGYQCTHCEYNAHKQCLDKINDNCSKKKKENRKSMFDKIGIRKPTANNVQAIREAQRLHEEGLQAGAQATQSTVFGHRVIKDEDEDELDNLRTQGHVQKLTEMFDTGTSPSSDDNKAHNRSLSPELEEEQRHIDVQVDDQTLKTLGHSGSSSTSSLSVMPESPSQSHDTLSEGSGSSGSVTPRLNQQQQLEEMNRDSDMEIEHELPSLDKVIPKDQLKKLKPKEKKRQDVLNELLYTEHNHLRNLKVMKYVFYPYLSQVQDDLVKILLPNLDQLIEVHGDLHRNFQKVRQQNAVINSIADMVLERFDSENGDHFKQVCATFCRDQSHGLEVFRHRMRKDQKLAQTLQELSNNPHCRRLELKDLIPTVMQRLTKYPLLLESLIKYTPGSETKENEKLHRALKCTKDILAFVNQAVKECENKHRLEDLQRRLKVYDDLQHENLDLRDHKLIYEGPLVWRLNKQKQVELHAVLLEDVLVLLQKQDNDKLVLRMHSLTITPQNKFVHSPIVVTSKMFIKNVATDKKAFFVVSNQDKPQIYELIAYSTESKKIWFQTLQDLTKYYEGLSGPAVQNRQQAISRMPSSISDVELRQPSLRPGNRSVSMDVVHAPSQASSEVVPPTVDLIDPSAVVVHEPARLPEESSCDAGTERVAEATKSVSAVEDSRVSESQFLLLQKSLDDIRLLNDLVKDPSHSVPKSDNLQDEECVTVSRQQVLSITARLQHQLQAYMVMQGKDSVVPPTPTLVVPPVTLLPSSPTDLTSAPSPEPILDSEGDPEPTLVDPEPTLVDPEPTLVDPEAALDGLEAMTASEERRHSSTDHSSESESEDEEETSQSFVPQHEAALTPHVVSEEETEEIQETSEDGEARASMDRESTEDSETRASMDRESREDSDDSDTEKLEIHEESEEEDGSPSPQGHVEEMKAIEEMAIPMTRELLEQPASPHDSQQPASTQDLQCVALEDSDTETVPAMYQTTAAVTDYFEEIRAELVPAVDCVTTEAEEDSSAPDVVQTKRSQSEMDCQTEDDPELNALLEQLAEQHMGEEEEEDEGETCSEDGDQSSQDAEEFHDSRENLEETPA